MTGAKIEKLEEKLGSLNQNDSADPLDRIRTLNELAWELRHADIRRASQAGRRARDMLACHPDPKEQVKCNVTLAEIYYRKGDYRQALRLGKEALTTARQEALDCLRPYILSTLGGVHWMLGDLAEALAQFQQQHRIARQLDDSQNEADALSNMGVIYNLTGDLDSSAKSFLKSFTLYEAMGDANGQARVMNNLAMEFHEAGAYAEALPKALKALELTRLAGNEILEQGILDTLGQIYLNQLDFAEAHTYFEKSLELAVSNGVTSDKAVALLRIGQLHSRQAEADQALFYLGQALQLLEATDQKVELSECHLLLSGVYEGREDFSKALQHYKQYHLLKEQIFNMNSERKLRQLLAAHEIEAARKEVELVKVRNRELQDALDRVNQLSGLLPICSNCKKIRDDAGYWHDVAHYIRAHSEADFTHGICPKCKDKLYPELFKK